MNNKLNLSSCVIVLLLLISFQEVIAQRTIGRPLLIDERDNERNAACATQAQNSFIFIASLSPGDALPSGNEFIFELSDPDGSFDTGQNRELGRIDRPNNGTTTTQEIRIEGIALPTDVNSDFYRVRVRTTEAGIQSQPSDDIAMHYFDTRLRVILNNRNDVFVCNSTTINETITVTMRDDMGNAVDPNQFDWIWFRDGALITGASGPSLQVTTEGTYRASIPFGLCQPFYTANGSAGNSNNVDVILLDQDAVTVSTPSPDFSYCPEETKVLISSEQDSDFSYQWYKDGEPIAGAIAPTITLPLNNFQGEYYVEVQFGNEGCTLQSTPPTIVTNEGSSITQELPENLIILPNEIITLEVLTDAPDGSPFRWRVNTNVQEQGIVSGPSLTYVIDDGIVGEYRVEIDANDPCDSRLFSETEIFAPVNFDITIGTTGENLCSEDTVQLELLEMQGRTNTGFLVPLTPEQLNFFDFEWYRDGVPLGETSLSLTVDRSDSGGNYQLRANFRGPEFGETISNNLPISFVADDIELTVTPESLPEDGSPVTITAPFDSNYTYEWYIIVDGEEQLIAGENENTLQTNQEGTYFVRISSLICTADSLPVTVGIPSGPSEIIPNVISFNGQAFRNWTLPQSMLSDGTVEVIIYDSRGREDLRTTNYQNNWPTENSRTGGKDAVYYYIITKNSTVLRKGSITVMR
ncbi:hypothetical protein [Aquimarina brevivitae]|uniref:CHU domain-containing protein n=1 Tax=Aquimarina brevivitae TaxID=323412 RepID=A0A4Q7PFS3_9FLAO|nr:hypothetical protein [Aquimarina brevivitae]RZS99324.1 hypothetical protein EV197_0533 [Aquimarina brevivitae]